MDEKELQERLAELRDTWRVPRDPPVAEMWQAIEARVFPLPRRGAGSRWIRTILPLAATLVLGFAIGRITPAVPRGAPGEAAPAEAGPSASPSAPFVGVANNYLERVTALLVTLTEEAGQGQPFNYSSVRARDLLATTRLLLDAPDLTDPVLRDLLDDLELVLAQIVRLPQRATAPDVYLIDQALDQREVLPRLRVMLAENPTSEP
ncbi:MAG TPA: hypothetical protein VI383_11745 [Gemmatimonadales bacterium]|nr:hypothetical protein [Gemmatimonadales bacterium]